MIPRRAVPALVSLLLFAPISAEPRTWNIHPDGSGDAPTIQAGIDSAATADTVLLSDGVYTGDGNRDTRFEGKAIVVRSASHAPDACVVDCEGGVGSSHRGFTFANGEGPGSVLEGITVEHGRMDVGAGVLCRGSSPTLRECVFVSNCASDSGGGLYCVENASPAVTACRFEGNTAGNCGGGIACYDWADPVVSNCVFDGNSANENGGGAYAFHHTHPTFVECSFSDSAGLNGGGFFSFDSDPTLLRCVFNGCEAELCGGGFYSHGLSTPVIDSCAFSGNFAGTKGGGLCIISTDNVPYLRNSAVYGNTATIGGGLYVGATDLRIRHDTFYGNSASEHGGGIYCEVNAWPVIRYTIIAFSTEGEALFSSDDRDTCLIVCSDLYGNAGGDWVGNIALQLDSSGNQWADPLFCDAPAGELSLQPSSPCLDAPGCGLVGAFGDACAATGLAEGDAFPAGAPGLFLSPSPSLGAVTIRFALPPSVSGKLDVYTISGRIVRTFPALGRSSAEVWDGMDAEGRPAPPGVYFVRLSAGAAVAVKRVVLIR